ncbi:carboxypeptidase-like regulatory domain-containing protein [Marinifilum sp.]|uniref:carboxypeptidase-like regulatory domain-containing protein n=1 Tax=Marinifilum sp. TaxID=2033137 RepID=UPI003BA9997C
MIQEYVLKLQAYQQTADILNENQSVFESDEITKSQIAFFNTKIDSILGIQANLNQPTKWITIEKNEALKSIKVKSHQIIVAIMRLANATDDLQLIEKINLAKKNIAKSSNISILSGVSDLCIIIEAYSTPLLDYDISAETITSFKQNIDSIEDKLAQRKQIKNQNKYNNQAFNKLITEISSFLSKKLDWSIESYRKSNPDVVEAYFSLRKASKVPIKHIDLRGFVVDKETGERIANGTVHVVENVMQTKITKKGNFSFKNFPEGEFTLQIENIGYQSTMLTIRRYNNQYLNLKVEMQALPVPHPAE